MTKPWLRMSHSDRSGEVPALSRRLEIVLGLLPYARSLRKIVRMLSGVDSPSIPLRSGQGLATMTVEARELLRYFDRSTMKYCPRNHAGRIV